MKLNDVYTTNYLKTSKTSELRYVFPTNICGASASAGAGARAKLELEPESAPGSLEVSWPSTRRKPAGSADRKRYSPVRVIFL